MQYIAIIFNDIVIIMRIKDLSPFFLATHNYYTVKFGSILPNFRIVETMMCNRLVDT